MPYAPVDLTRIKTYPLVRRENRVALEDLITPDTPCPPFENLELAEVAARVAAARSAGRPVIMMFGGHIIKRGLAPLVIDLLRKGVITHLASNGAAAIHDFEIAFLGHTSEDVAKSLADGSFGMAEETGALMNAAIRSGAADGLGMGEALGRLIAGDARFAFRENSVLYTAHSLGIPYTVHVALGTDIIHQHPGVDFAATGWATGQDFKIFAQAVCGLEGGVFLNFGSAVIGPEVFLKAISIARNLGNPVRVFTTANFDIIPMKDYREPVDDHNPDYYYRPRKNVVNRPVMLGGRGYHITGDHIQTLPTLYRMVMSQFEPVPPVNQDSAGSIDIEDGDFTLRSPAAAAVLDRALKISPELADVRRDITRAYTVIARCFQTGGTLFLTGTGEINNDVEWISTISNTADFEFRSIPAQHRQQLQRLPGGKDLSEHLRAGMRCVILGNNPALPIAMDEDPGFPIDADQDASMPPIGLAQELYIMARPGDVLLGIGPHSSSGSFLYPASVARLKGMYSILLGRPAKSAEHLADIVIKVLARKTPADLVAWQNRLVRCLWEMLVAQLIPAGDRR